MILKLLAYLERKRNCLLWEIFDYFFFHDYEYLDLHEWCFKYDRLFNKETIENYERENKKRIKQLEYDKKHVELYASQMIAKEFEVLDLDTGEFIPKCLYANQSLGCYVCYKLNKKNRFHKVECYGNIALVWKDEEILDKTTLDMLYL